MVLFVSVSPTKMLQDAVHCWLIRIIALKHQIPQYKMHNIFFFVRHGHEGG